MPPRVAVAVSGGRDSTALLHCTAHWARAHGAQVLALHVHHGLMPQADDWLAHLQRQCRRWARAGLPVQLQTHRLTGTPSPGDSVEAWAREQRYAALATMAHAARCDIVLLAQHRRDQAETFLLQALRGSGPRGLAAMPASRDSQGLRWARPWLDQPRDAIEAYVARHHLRCIDDASNRDPRFARSRLRQAVWPALVQAFPQAEASLAAASRRAFEADTCLGALAALDLDGAMPDDDMLCVEPIVRLPPARAANALRHGLSRLIGPGRGGVPQSLIDRLLAELALRHHGRWPAPGGGELRLHDGVLRHHGRGPEIRDTVPDSIQVDLHRSGEFRLPGRLGTLSVTPVKSGGVATADLREVEVRARQGGEQFQFEPASQPRALKKQFQARRVPAWVRQGPLLFAQGRLLFVPGLGIDARALAGPGQRQMQLAWTPDDLR